MANVALGGEDRRPMTHALRSLCALALLTLSSARAEDELTFHTVADVPLPGRAARFDYQAVDPAAHRLYIAHMGDDHLVVVDTERREVLAHLPGFGNVHGVLIVPELGKVYASATRDRDVVALDAATLKVVARCGSVGYGDGLAWAPPVQKVYVSDQSAAGRELVIDAAHDRALGTIELGGEAGNTVWEPTSGRVLVAVQTRQEVVEIDPARDAIVARHRLDGAEHPHGLCVDTAHGRLYVADEERAQVLVVDLARWTVLARHDVTRGPDVLALDPEAGRLYVACEGGALHAFRTGDEGLRPLATLRLPHAHTVAVDPRTHLVYLPLADVDGKPVLRVLALE